MTDAPAGRGRTAPWLERLLGPACGRQLVIATLISTFGSGAFASTVVFYLIGRGAGLAAIGFWMTIGGAAAIVLSPQLAMFLGQLRPGAGLVGLHLARAAIFFTIPFIPVSLALPLISMAIMMDKASAPTLQAFMSVVFTGPDRLRVLGYRRAVANVGLGAGTAAGGVLLATDSGRVLFSAFFVNAITFLFAAYAVWAAAQASSARTSPRPAQREGRTGRRVRDFRGRLVLIALCGSLTVYDVLLTFGIPTIVLTLDLASWWSSVALGLSFVLVSSLQVPSTSFVDKRGTPNSRLGQVGGFLIALGCALISLSSGGLAVVGLLGAVVCWSLAELSITNLIWRLPLAIEDDPLRMSDLIAQLSLGNNATVAVMPSLIAAVIVPLGALGWMVLAGIMLVSALASSGRTLRDIS